MITTPEQLKREAYKFYNDNISPIDTFIKDDVMYVRNVGHNDQLDAFRHAYVSGRMAMEYDADTSRLLGSANEVIHWNKDPRERNMDFWNNEVGIEYEKKSSTPQELAENLKEAMENGELILNFDDSRKFTPKLTTEEMFMIMENGEEFQIFKGDIANQLADSGMIATDATFVDSEGNPASMLHRDVIVFTDENGETYTIIKYGTKTPAKDGLMYDLVDLSKQLVNGIENTAKFIITQASEFTGNYGSYLADNKENIIGDILARVLLGESLGDAMKAVAEVWGINALLNNDSSNALISNMLGISPDMISNGVENGYFIYVRDTKGNIIKDAQGQLLLELTGEGEATFLGATGSEWMYGARVANNSVSLQLNV